MSTRRLRPDLNYGSTDFRGQTAQPGLHTVQSEVKAVLVITSRKDVVMMIAGCTNAGAYVRYQIYHADISGVAWTRLSPRRGESDERVVASMIIRRLNKTLSGRYGEHARGRDLAATRGIYDVRIYSAAAVDPSFNTYFSALGRPHTYRVFNRPGPLGRWDCLWVEEPLDEAAMSEAGAALLGGHDSLRFYHPREGATTIRTLRTLLTERDAEGTLVFRVEADTFCRSMVHSLVGALLLVGSGARDVAYPVQIPRVRSRPKAAPIAPTRGLALEGAEYLDPLQWCTQAKQTRTRRDTCCGDDG